MSLKDCAEQASREVQDTFELSLSSKDADKLTAVIERAIVEAVRMSCESSTKAASSILEAESDKAHKIAKRIHQEQDVMVANLSRIPGDR